MPAKASRLARIRQLASDLMPAADLWLIIGGIAGAIVLAWLL